REPLPVLDQHADAADVLLGFAEVRGVPAPADEAHLAFELRPRPDRPAGQALEALPGVEGSEAVRRERGKERLAGRGAVRRQEEAGAIADPHRPGALDAVEEEHLAALEGNQMNGLRRLPAQRREDRPRLRAEF